MDVTKGTYPRVKAKGEVEDAAMGVVTHKVEVVENVSFAEANTHQGSVLHMDRHVSNALGKTFCKSVQV